jgi:hypothetical protein
MIDRRLTMGQAMARLRLTGLSTDIVHFILIPNHRSLSHFVCVLLGWENGHSGNLDKACKFGKRFALDQMQFNYWYSSYCSHCMHHID